MRRYLAYIAFGLPLLTPLGAQEESVERTNEEMDPIAAAIEAFNNRDRSEPNEVVAVLDPPAGSGSKDDDSATKEGSEGGPVLVTGKRPKNSDLIDISEIPLDPDAASELPPADAEQSKGLRVRVERVQAGQGKLEPENIRLLAPFPAKPLDQAPEGWLLETSDTAPAFKRRVELAPGKAINLTIRPHILVPDADQDQILAVAEPGFEASLGYQQSDTVAAVLSDSIRRLDEDSRQIGDAIDQLQQLIVSLPKPEEGASSIPDAQDPIPESP